MRGVFNAVDASENPKDWLEVIGSPKRLIMMISQEVLHGTHRPRGGYLTPVTSSCLPTSLYASADRVNAGEKRASCRSPGLGGVFLSTSAQLLMPQKVKSGSEGARST